MVINPSIVWRSRVYAAAPSIESTAGRWRLIQTGSLVTIWRPRAYVPGSPHIAKVIQTGTLVTFWRSRFAGPPPVIPPTLLTCHADGVGTAVALLNSGTFISLSCHADGIGSAAVNHLIGAAEVLHCHADGVGSAKCVLDGGTVNITCETTGVVGGSPPTPKIGVLFDSPFSY